MLLESNQTHRLRLYGDLLLLHLASSNLVNSAISASHKDPILYIELSLCDDEDRHGSQLDLLLHCLPFWLQDYDLTVLSAEDEQLHCLLLVQTLVDLAHTSDVVLVDMHCLLLFLISRLLIGKHEKEHFEKLENHGENASYRAKQVPTKSCTV